MALFVGIFLILNTFSIIVAQRTRELALMRAIGASRGQVIGSVMMEAVVIGLIASVVGLGGRDRRRRAAGEAVREFGRRARTAPRIGVPAAAIIESFAVGIIVTVIAAVMPALRASRIAAGRGDAGGGHAGPAAHQDHDRRRAAWPLRRGLTGLRARPERRCV